jgi:superfamily II DNA or RNA helicase
MSLPNPWAGPASTTPVRDKVTLRPYQARAESQIFDEFASGKRSTLLILPTGTGKTIVFGSVARKVINRGGRVLILAHRGELLDQAADKLAAFGIESAIEKAEQNARACLWGEPDCVIASVQTMKGRRLETSWPRGYFKLIVTDEAHHAPAESYRRIYDHLRPEWHLGVTATADRLDGENLGQVYQTVAFEYPMREAIEAGYLSRLRFVRCETTVDLSKIRTTAGDLNLGDVEKAITPHIEELANGIRQEIGDRKTIVFTPDVGSAEGMASALSEWFSTDSISGASKDRKRILDDFQRGKTQVLCNCQILSEGYDEPSVSAIVLLRPTESRALFSQQVGRGTRPFPGKEDLLVVDFAWLTGRHHLVSPVELFDTTVMDAEVQALASAMVKSGEAPDLLDAIERAEASHEEKVKLRIKIREREARYRRVSYDPFAAMETLGRGVRMESEASLKIRATEKQVATLQKLGVTDAGSMSKRRATQMLDILFQRMDRKLATLKQVSWMIARGVEPDVARAMTKDKATEELSRIFGNRRPDRTPPESRP